MSKNGSWCLKINYKFKNWLGNPKTGYGHNRFMKLNLIIYILIIKNDYDK